MNKNLAVNNKRRRSDSKIMASLFTLLGSLSYVMVLAVINGTLGHLCALGVTLFGTVGVAKLMELQILGATTISMSFTAIIVLTVVSGLLRGLLRYVEQYSNHYIAFKLLAVLRDKIFSSLRILCPAKLETKKKGAIISMITSDIETLEVFYAHTISPLCIAAIFSTTILLFLGFYVSWYMALVAFLSYVIIGIICPIISSKLMRETGAKYREEFSNFNAYYLDGIKGLEDVILNNEEEERLKEVNKKSDSLLKQTKILKSKISKTTAFTDLIISLCIILQIIAGALLVVYGNLAVSKIVIGIVLFMSSFGPVIAVSALPSNLNQTFASGDRVLDLIEEEPETEPIIDGVNLNINEVQVVDLTFDYEKDEEVLKNINMFAKKGEIVGIMGESGCGKSTLLKLMLRFYNKDKGEILYNGIEINDINTSCLLKNCTLVSQTTYLFDETIADNLRIAKMNASDEELIEACKKASIHDFITKLPKGYDTPVGLLGDNLSAGEKQRIGLARAFLSESNIILLDEPTSNVDSINEGIILKSLLDRKNEKGIILVSHRPSTMAVCDRVYRINDGIIQENK